MNHELSRRERQIMDIVHSLGEASVGDIGGALPDPPTSQAVRRMVQILSEKGILEVERRGKKNIYKPAIAKKKIRHNALEHLVKTYFDGSVIKTMATMLDANAVDLSNEDAFSLVHQIENARQEGR